MCINTLHKGDSDDDDNNNNNNNNNNFIFLGGSKEMPSSLADTRGPQLYIRRSL
jgi:hypothetical protein